jgi:hypothetical protein
MPWLGYAETYLLDLSNFDPEESSITKEFKSLSHEKKDVKDDILYSNSSGDNSDFFYAMDYNYPTEGKDPGIFFTKAKIETVTQERVKVELHRIAYALNKDYDIQLNSNAFSVVDTKGNTVSRLPKLTFGTKDSPCVYFGMSNGEDQFNTYNFETCQVTIRAISEETGQEYLFTSILDGITANPSTANNTTLESSIYNSENEHIGYLKLNVKSGEFSFFDLDHVPF